MKRAVHKAISSVEHLAEDFIKPGGNGEAAQKIIENIDKQAENWIMDLWAKVNYMEFRIPLIPDSPTTVFPLQNYKGLDPQLNYAVKVILGAMDYKEKLDRKEVPAYKQTKGPPNEMYQFHLFYGTYRVPGTELDDLRIGCIEDKPATHITVARNGHFFKVPVYDENLKKLNGAQLLAELHKVCEMSNQRNDESVGLLTGGDRTPWAKVYQNFKKDPGNAASMEAIETALFHVCLDSGNVVGSMPDDPWTAFAPEGLFGGGSHSNTINRWFDKALQFVIGEDGGCGLNWEHGPGEAPAPADIADYVLDYITAGSPATVPAATGSIGSVSPLNFSLSESDKGAMRDAVKSIDALANRVNFRMFSFNHYGKNFPKTIKSSPDSYIQVAFQLAYYRLRGTPVVRTYESGGLRMFKLGRTDTVRHPTAQSIALCNAIDTSASIEEKAKLIMDAIAAHNFNLKQTTQGKGFDRHLVALKETALRNNLPLHPFFQCDAYKKLTNFRVSTSQCANRNDCATLYGPSGDENCLGCSYNPRETNINFMVATWKDLPEMAARKFGECLERSLLDMRRILDAAKPSAAA